MKDTSNTHKSSKKPRILLPLWKVQWQMMEKYLLLFGFLELKITYGMKDQISVEATSTTSGDVPNNSDDMVATLPEAPDVIEVDSKKE